MLRLVVSYQDFKTFGLSEKKFRKVFCGAGFICSYTNEIFLLISLGRKMDKFLFTPFKIYLIDYSVHVGHIYPFDLE